MWCSGFSGCPGPQTRSEASQRTPLRHWYLRTATAGKTVLYTNDNTLVILIAVVSRCAIRLQPIFRPNKYDSVFQHTTLRSCPPHPTWKLMTSCRFHTKYIKLRCPHHIVARVKHVVNILRSRLQHAEQGIFLSVHAVLPFPPFQ